MIDVVVIQKPIYVKGECEKCFEEIKIPYADFIKEYGQPPDWPGHTITCPNPDCGHENEIDGWEFD